MWRCLHNIIMTERNNTPAPRPEPKPEPRQQKSASEKTQEELKTEAAEKKQNGKEKVRKNTKQGLASLSAGLGGDFGFLMKQWFETFENFVKNFDGIKDKVSNLFMAQNPDEINKILSKSKDYKLPRVDKPEKVSTTLEPPKTDEKLVQYLYRCLKIPTPTKEQLAPLKKLDIKHLMFQLMTSFKFEKGATEINKGFTKKPVKFHKNDITFFRNKLTGELTAGFVQKIENKEPKITIITMDDTGKQTTTSKYTSQLLIAFSIPGNTIQVKEQEKANSDVDS